MGGTTLEAVVNEMIQRPLPSPRMWEIESFTDGSALHGVILRWNYWIGDGLSTQACIGKLFEHPFEVSAAVQKRVDNPELANRSMIWPIFKYSWRQLMLT